MSATSRRGTYCPSGKVIGNACERTRIVAQRFWQADHEREASIALEDLADGLAADRGLDDGLHVRDVQAIAPEQRAPRLHRQDGQAAHLLEGDVRAAGHGRDDSLDLLADRKQRIGRSSP